MMIALDVSKSMLAQDIQPKQAGARKTSDFKDH